MKEFYALIFLLIVTPIFAQDLDDETISKKAKEMKIDVYYASIDSNTNEVVQGERKSGYKSKTYIKYTKKGKLSERYYKYDEGEFYLAFLCFYNDQNLLDSSASFIRNRPVPDSWGLFEYDTKKRETKSRNIEDDLRVRSRSENTYDKKGNLIETKSYYWEELDLITAFTYDSKGNKLVKTYTYPNQDNTQSTSKFEYDKHGNLLTEKHFDGTSKPGWSLQYQYNKQNQLTLQCNDRSTDSCIVTHKWKYDSYGNVVEQRILANGDNNEKYWRIHKMVYQYDKKKNWIKKTVYYNDKPITIVVRTITY